MNEFVLPGLVERRAMLAGELETARARLDRLYADLAAVDAVIRQLDPAYPVDDIQMRQARSPMLGVLKDMSRSVLGMLREAGGPMTIAALADQVMEERALDAASPALRSAVVESIGRAIRHQRDRGVIRQNGKQGRARLWEVAE
ncbi:hypothetical protein [Roseicella sp. DB1501]|uniref:hypothetical protein n=1 Tax=Roseicella sp. DB1501 TaxID=2730925 RepID=UPI001490D763|nr:hypothetical protein [Roseicella sp. DB1501]NOG71548.1 hypothetical protein [Roseicella sp. DB1501]